MRMPIDEGICGGSNIGANFGVKEIGTVCCECKVREKNCDHAY